MLQKEKLEQAFQKIMQRYDKGLQKEVLLQELVRTFNLDVHGHLREQIEVLLERELTPTEIEKVKTLSFLQHHGTERKGYSHLLVLRQKVKNSDFRATAILLAFILVFIYMGTIALPLHPASPPAATLTSTPTSTPTFTPTVSSLTPSIPSPIVSTPAFLLSDACKLPSIGSDYDYLVPGHLLLEDVYRKKFSSDPDSNDLYAIAYYNNRKILEGYSQYHIIDPISLDVRRGWKIFIPPQDWMDEYKKFPATIPLPTQTDSQSKLYISGSSILSHLSAQISKCSKEVTGIELVQSDVGNTASGLQDLCQSKVDLFGANKEVDAAICGGIELEKFEVAKYAMVVLINENNPNADDIQRNPLTSEELKKLLIDAYSWKKVRGYWTGTETITRHYPPLESGEFEIINDGIFPNQVVFNIEGLNIYNDGQSLIDAVAKDVNAVGIVDYASYQRCKNKNQLIAIPVNGVYAGSAIANNDSKYPLMVTLYLYAEKHAYESNHALRNFINYYLSHELDFLDDLGYLYPSRKGYTGNPDTVP
jgi:ABC-type phosphate transport system substrate-binding protein